MKSEQFYAIVLLEDRGTGIGIVPLVQNIVYNTLEEAQDAIQLLQSSQGIARYVLVRIPF